MKNMFRHGREKKGIFQDKHEQHYNSTTFFQRSAAHRFDQETNVHQIPQT